MVNDQLMPTRVHEKLIQTLLDDSKKTNTGITGINEKSEDCTESPTFFTEEKIFQT